MNYNQQRSTKLAEEALNRPKVIADVLFDKYDEDFNRALDDLMAWGMFLQRLRITPMNSGTVWPPCIPQEDTTTSDGLRLIGRQVVTNELDTIAHGLRAFVRRSGERIERKVRAEVARQATPID